jgi:phage terminase small subunit
MGQAFQVGQSETGGELLNLLCDALSRYMEARQLISDGGLMVPGRSGEKKRNPALIIEKDSRYAMLRLFAQLEAGQSRSQARSVAAEAALEDALCSTSGLRALQ